MNDSTIDNTVSSAGVLLKPTHLSNQKLKKIALMSQVSSNSNSNSNQLSGQSQSAQPRNNSQKTKKSKAFGLANHHPAKRQDLNHSEVVEGTNGNDNYRSHDKAPISAAADPT